MPAPLKYTSKDFVIYGSLIGLLDERQAWAALDKRVRTSIRKGERMDVHIRPLSGAAEERDALRAMTPNDDDIPNEIDEGYQAYVATDGSSGDRLGWILLKAIKQKLFLLCHASSSEGKKRQTPNLLLWHAIKLNIGGPWKWMDIGASYRPSLQQYFTGFRESQYPLILNDPKLPIDLRITPFDTTSYGVSPGDPVSGRRKLAEEFDTDCFTIFPRAMYAISACLREYVLMGKLTSEDEVLITTTTETPYISSHVTRPIESVCRWSRIPSQQTRAVFLIHEFGFPNPRAQEWRRFCDQRGIPLIEDCAYGWGSDGVGNVGDVKIYSLTKHLPVQFGGVLVGMAIPFERMWNTHASSDLGKEHELLAMVDAVWMPTKAIRVARQEVWRRYAENLQSVLQPYYCMTPSVLPGSFIAKMENENEMKSVSAFVRRFGVEAGNWYYHDAIFLPCHQRMTSRHVDFVCGVMLANYRAGCGLVSS